MTDFPADPLPFYPKTLRQIADLVDHVTALEAMGKDIYLQQHIQVMDSDGTIWGHLDDAGVGRFFVPFVPVTVTGPSAECPASGRITLP